MAHKIFGFSQSFLLRLSPVWRHLVNRSFTPLQVLGVIYVLLQLAGILGFYPLLLVCLLLVGLGLLVPVLLAFKYVVERQTRASSLSSLSRRLMCLAGYLLSLLLAMTVLCCGSFMLLLAYTILGG